MHVTTAARCDELYKDSVHIAPRFLTEMFFCRRIRDSGSDVQYYLLVDLHEDAEDLEYGTSFDIQVTDGRLAWNQEGVPALQDQPGALLAPGL